MIPEAAVLALLVAHEIGKAGTHALRHAAWARRPLLPGLALSDTYHILSAIQWPVVLFAGWCSWGLSWKWWAIAIALWGAVWPLSKIGKGLTLRQAFGECWYVQLYKWAR